MANFYVSCVQNLREEVFYLTWPTFTYKKKMYSNLNPYVNSDYCYFANTLSRSIG